ncbi:zinc-dependent metalloprotease [Paraglaciecola hydrolytica]|uniref:Peptidase n=1 Tax=Paraglaciecola hydrolytica TaxID=1799789 RepID=A0A148KKM3_9ALTE|nr:zinc-dependent metalloprotease [Paraglaciecola hydrolytica]KXI26830.1 peptidase [Paraglaciecola hydrolytica]
MRVNFLLVSLIIFSLSAIAKEDKTLTIKDFTQGMQQQTGFFSFYYQAEQDKVFLQINDFTQTFLFQSSMPQGIGSNDIGLDRGQLGETRLVKFERYGNKVMLKQLNTTYRASSTNAAEQASIDEAFADSVIAGFPVVAVDGKSVLIDYSAFLLSDIHNISGQLDNTKQGSYKPDAMRSGVYLPRSKAFADNTELEALVTFTGGKAGEYLRQVTPDPSSISVHLHHSFIRLPDDQYQPRQFTPYSGYWEVGYQDYSAPIDQSMAVQLIPRHRLHKKDPNAQVSEAVEPIVYYLDPGIPEPVMSALKDGALWWDQAFTAIGYKNAFQVKVLPEGADPMDVRYNVIQWVHRATRGWSYGSSVIDPRTGEIIKGHVTLGSLRVRQDYLIALGLTSPFSDNGQDDLNVDTSAQREMALARIRQLSAHEVGHTLGIAHNFSPSEYGRESVMDYPHPYVSIKDGKISLDGAYAVGMGAWDNYVIAYGYQDFPKASNETTALQALVQQARDKNYAYQSDPDARPGHAANPSGNLWDSGADAVDELARLSKVRELALANFGLKTLKSGSSLSSLEETLVPIYLLHRYQVEAVAKLVGGVDYEYELKGDYPQAKGAVAVAADKQKAAINALLTTLQTDYLAIPESITRLITPKAYGESRNRESFNGRTGLTFDPLSAAESAANYSVELLLKAERLNRVAQQATNKKGAPTVSSVVASLFANTIQKSQSKSHAELANRISHVVLNATVNASLQDNLAPEVRAELELGLLDLLKWLKNNERNSQHKIMAKQLEQFMQSGEWKSSFKAKALPPGSPI